MTDYTKLSLAQVADALNEIAAETQTVFGGLEERRLNWKPDPARWSVAQCFEHLVTANQLMLDQANHALSHPAASIWQRLPVLPGLLGAALVRSQAPEATRRYVADPKAQPAASDIPTAVLGRFSQQQIDTARWVGELDAGTAQRTNMVSPFAKVISYSVLDGCRLLAAHNRRHFEQARRVTQAVSFPSPR